MNVSLRLMHSVAALLLFCFGIELTEIKYSIFVENTFAYNL